MDGNEALAYGLIAAGVRFGGYPITPWSDIMELLRLRTAEVRRLVRPVSKTSWPPFLDGARSQLSGHLAVTGSADRAFR